MFKEEPTQEHNAPSADSEVAPEEENEHDCGSSAQTTTCVKHSLTLSLTRTTTVMPNRIGNTEVERRTNVCFRENITPGDVDMETLICDKLSGIPLHFQAQRHRQCPGNYSV